MDFKNFRESLRYKFSKDFIGRFLTLLTNRVYILSGITPVLVRSNIFTENL